MIVIEGCLLVKKHERLTDSCLVNIPISRTYCCPFSLALQDLPFHHNPYHRPIISISKVFEWKTSRDITRFRVLLAWLLLTLSHFEVSAWRDRLSGQVRVVFEPNMMLVPVSMKVGDGTVLQSHPSMFMGSCNAMRYRYEDVGRGLQG